MDRARVAVLIWSLSICLFPREAWSRPEYAAQQKVNCVTCHVTPWGGGPRTVYGKIYGSQGHKLSPFSSSDLYYGDLRFIAYYPIEKTEQRSSGAALMEAAVSANVPVIALENGFELRTLLTYNMPSISSPTVREAYLRWQLPSTDNPFPPQFVFGRFYVPFGLLTDEHRTYTRIQTHMTMNNFHVGGAFSSGFNNELRYDIALVSDFQTGGALVSNDIPFGAVLNLRWNPVNLPFLMGVSGNYERLLSLPDPYAGSLYGVLSLDRLTQDAVSASLSLETVLAQDWNNIAVNPGLVNPGLIPFFQPPVTGNTSFGIYGLARYNVTQRWTLLYKFDFLAPEANQLGESYTRHGIGVEGKFTGNLIFNTRLEFTAVPASASPQANALGYQPDIFAMLRMWL